MALVGRWIQPVTLDGRRVRLEPLTADHLPALVEVGLDPSLWRWTLSLIETPADMAAYVGAALAAAKAGAEVPFVTVDREAGRVVGSTRFLSIEAQHRRLEIGYTWLGPPWQRSHVNTEAKLLMLRHAFEDRAAIRVEFKTDSLNEQSRRALAGIGAVEEGTFRNHMISQGGRRRHSTYFSIIEEEWPQVRDRLAKRLARRSVPVRLNRLA
jgi:RimJ/RimL family protein N-acetyltransferase